MPAPMIALATCREHPDHDADEAPLLAALRARGADVRMLVWNDDEPRHPTELVVLRSTWDYYRDVDGFLAWVARAGRAARLLNPAHVVAANARKTYLRDLEARGVAIVPTAWAPRGSHVSVDEILTSRGWTKIVIKPVVSAGSFKTRSFGASEALAAQAFLDELTAERDAMIQSWMPSVDGYGERSLVWIDGALSHAVRKAPRFAGGDETRVEPRPIAPEERALAERILAPIAKELLYARVDVIWDACPTNEARGGTLRLMELELIEPSLFLQESPGALDRFADAIVRHAVGGLS